jgi:hypothetical protein
VIGPEQKRFGLKAAMRSELVLRRNRKTTPRSARDARSAIAIR